MKRIICLLILILLISGCKVSKEQRDLSCQECNFNKSTDSIYCNNWGQDTTLIECDGNNYIYAFKTTSSNIVWDKWGRYDKTEYGKTEIITMCEEINC